jgi:hypothetical protein
VFVIEDYTCINGASCWDCNIIFCLFTEQKCGLSKSVENAPWGLLWLHFQLVRVLFRFELKQVISAVGVCVNTCVLLHMYIESLKVMYVIDLCYLRQMGK